MGILGNASLALDVVPPLSPARSSLEDVVKAAERAAGLTRELLAYAGKGRFFIERVDLSTLVRETATLLHTSIPRSVQLRLDVPPALPPVEADVAQVQQVLMNLVINAAEAIGERPGLVTVRAGVRDIGRDGPDTLTGPHVFVKVTDTGSGMDSATRARIFDPFFTTKFTGRGLGLAAVQGIVRGHHGRIHVESAPERGSAFTVLLPAAPAPAAAVSAPVVKDLAGSGTVLVIDDEETVRRTAMASLERYGYAVVTAEHGRAAIDLLTRSPDGIGAVLLDLTMPVMAGEETLREIRELRPELPVVLSSGFDEVEAVRRFAGMGLAGFLKKPYTPARLAEALKSAVAARRSAQNH